MKMSATLRVIVMFVAGILMVAGVGLLYHEKQKSEPVWAEGERAIMWELSRFPLKVWLDTELADVYTESLHSATGLLNTGAGCPLLAVTKGQEEAAVWVMFEPCEEKGDVGCAFYSPANRRGIIKSGRPGNIAEAHVMFAHELGHILGLAHDGWADRESKAVMVSAMANNVTEVADSMVRLTSKDAKALGERYCK